MIRKYWKFKKPFYVVYHWFRRRFCPIDYSSEKYKEWNIDPTTRTPTPRRFG